VDGRDAQGSIVERTIARTLRPSRLQSRMIDRAD
jgi:hypothetical protein